ncbi:hypothetical protein [Shimazuella soli]|nr:hypothetical protein [Shimazuella soli]
MNTVLFHLILIPGVFMSGYLFASIKVVAFHTAKKEKVKSYNNEM